MADHEVRDALTRRLHKNLGDASSPEGSPFRSSKLSRPPLSKVCAFNAPVPCVVSGDVRVEGYLYKYSSGQFSRWQKRFFILDAGKLSYYKKFPSDRDPRSAVPKKVFSVRRIRAVSAAKKNNREFELVFSSNRSYQMRAASTEDVNKWISSFQAAIAFCEANPDCSPIHDDDGMSDLGDGSGGSTNSHSNFSEISPTSNFLYSLGPRRDSVASTSSAVVAFEKIVLDPELLSKNFEEWFYFVPTTERQTGGAIVHREIRITHVIDACNRVNNNLWSVLGGFPRGTDIKLDEALVRATRFASRADVNLMADAYITRLAGALSKCLDVRSAYISTQVAASFATSRVNYSAELPALVECVVKMISLLDKLTEAPTLCICCYCDPSGIALLRKRKTDKKYESSESSCSSQAWRKDFRVILQRLGAELELGLIEELQIIVSQADVAWEAPPVLSAHPLLDDNSTMILLSSFGPSFIQTAQSKCLNASSQWMAAYPLAARLVAEHVTSALVACLNSVARQFKRHAAASSLVVGVKPSNNSSMNTSSLNSSMCSEAETCGMWSFENLIAFGNESVLMKKFCEKAYGSTKFTPAIFIQCMGSLGEAFLGTAAEVCHSVVRIHLYPALRYDMLRAWNVKNLAKDKISPMDHCQALVGQQKDSLKLAAIACVKNACVELLASAVARSYATAMLKHKPRMKVFKTLPALFAHDIQVYKDVFVESQGDLPVLEEIGKLLNEKDRINFSIYFNTFVGLLGSPQQAYAILTSVTKMREHEFASSSERKEVAKMLSSMKQMVAKGSSEAAKQVVSPSTGTLNVGPSRINWNFEE